jgi:hypothetical protein
MKPLVRNIELVYRIHSAVMPPSTEDAAVFDAFVKQLEETIRCGLEPADREVSS